MDNYNVWAAWNSLIDKALQTTNDPHFIATLKNFRTSAILPKLGQNQTPFTGQFNWDMLRKAADETKNGAYVYDLLTQLGVAKNPFNVSVRDSILNSSALKKALGGDVNVTWDPKTRTILVNGKPFLTQDQFSVTNGKALTNSDIINQAIQNYLKSNMVIGGQHDNPNTDSSLQDNDDLSKMSDVDLQYNMKKLDMEGQLKTYQDALKLVGDNNNAIAKQITDTFDKLTQTALADLEESYNANKAALESEKGQVEAHYAGAEKEIDNAVKTAKSKSKEEMAARGIYFSGLMSRALTGIEEQGILQKSKVAAAKAADLNKIASQIAVLTSNYNIGKNKVKDMYAAQKGLQLLNLMTKTQEQKNQIQTMISGIQNQIDTLEKQKPYMEEIGKRQQEAAEAQAEQEAAKYNDQMSLKKGELALKWAQLWAKQGYDRDKLDEMKREFDETLQLNKNKFDFDKWYKQAQLSLKSYIANKNTSPEQKQTAQEIANTPLSQIINMDPAHLANYLKKIDSLKVQITDYNKLETTYEFPPELQSLKQQEGFIATLMDLGLHSAHLNDPANLKQYQEDLSKISNSLHNTDIDAFIRNYVTDPLAKIYTALYLKANGNPQKMQYLFYDGLDGIRARMQEYGIDDKKYWLELYKLLDLGTTRH